ncbi:hypothetical protein LTR56_017714 [Elasticomyces elasticus]|nr:hypothetical protein LTR56_017714 [Elasticomyces elasticus]KAK3637750.1 hypothetical protein LTR22_018151 [Elasticomyces elasticus]KAK4915352.1 hypothetical protein LTR49_016483 [Elasticomyces elasticus]KAK5752282.1 hypothetical protein LTS12_017676 [Elasticomyces elasticus]
MADHVPSRLLALPAELRVRIYDCLFEDESQQLEIDISLIKDHAPKVAIVAVSRLIRREALEMARQAVSHFFDHHKFFLDIHPVPKGGQDHQNRQDEQNAMAGLPRLPIPGFELRFSVWRISERIANRREQRKVSVKLAASYEPVEKPIVTLQYQELTEDGMYSGPWSIKTYASRSGMIENYMAIGEGKPFGRRIRQVVENFFDGLWSR